MCGIAAILYKRESVTERFPVGLQLREMLFAMRHRGVDSTGVAVGGERFSSQYVARLRAAGREARGGSSATRIKSAIAKVGGSVSSYSEVDSFLRIGIDYAGSVAVLADSLLTVPGFELHSIGRSSEVIKDTGDSYELDRKHQISKMTGTHGIGHVRLATESEVDIRHSHPFWAYPFPDISVVHNGQLTNYHTLKRKFEQRGYRFQTHNDSEVIGVYIAEKLSQGSPLDQALQQSLDDLDGTFTYVVTTASGIGMAKDRWSAKPFVIFENEEMVGVASEEVALRKVFPDMTERFEPQEHEVMSWNVAVAPIIGGRSKR